MQMTKKLLYKISQCIDFQNLYALEEEFNKVGLTIQTTSKNRMILCKLRKGRPLAEKVVDDYIFIGTLDNPTREITEKVAEKISDFVRNNQGKSDKVKDLARVWRNGLKMYEDIVVVNEDVNYVADRTPLLLE